MGDGWMEMENKLEEIETVTYLQHPFYSVFPLSEVF